MRGFTGTKRSPRRDTRAVLPCLQAAAKLSLAMNCRRRIAFPGAQISFLFLARMPVLADDDVVMDGNAERAGDLDDRLGHLINGSSVAG
jgi:hypothetical protein